MIDIPIEPINVPEPIVEQNQNTYIPPKHPMYLNGDNPTLKIGKIKIKKMAWEKLSEIIDDEINKTESGVI